MFKKIAATAMMAGASLAEFVTFNEKFGDYLHGKKTVDYNIFEKMWNAYESEFTSLKLHQNNDIIRKSNFEWTIKSIIEHNTNPKSTYKREVNKFSDLSWEEFAEYFNLKSSARGAEQHCSATQNRMSVAKNGVAAASHWDWRDHNGVSPVKNQGHCGSCWTFSTVGALEAHSMIKYDGQFDSLAEQQLVDCA